MAATPPTLGAILRAFSAAGGASSARSGRMNVILFAMPVFVLAFVGIAIRGYSTPTYFVGVFPESAAPSHAAFLRALEDDPSLAIRHYDDPEALRLSVYRGRMHLGIRLPPEGDAPEALDVWLAQAGAGSPVVRALVDRAWWQHRAAAPPSATIEVTDGDALGALPIGYRFTAPGQVVFFVLLNGIVSSAGILALRRVGLGRRLLASPLHPRELLLGLAIGPLQIATTQAIFLIVITTLFFGVPWGDPLGVVLVTVGLIATAVGLTLFAATVFPSDQAAIAIGPFLGVLLGMIGGTMWPLSIVPDGVATVALGFPSTWAMNAYLALGLQEATWIDVLPTLAVLVTMAAAFLGIGLVRLRTRLGG